MKSPPIPTHLDRMKSRRVYDPRSTFFSQEILYFECLTQRAGGGRAASAARV